jgi:hypothetical protein
MKTEKTRSKIIRRGNKIRWMWRRTIQCQRWIGDKRRRWETMKSWEMKWEMIRTIWWRRIWDIEWRIRSMKMRWSMEPSIHSCQRSWVQIVAVKKTWRIHPKKWTWWRWTRNIRMRMSPSSSLQLAMWLSVPRIIVHRWTYGDPITMREMTTNGK